MSFLATVHTKRHKDGGNARVGKCLWSVSEYDSLAEACLQFGVAAVANWKTISTSQASSQASALEKAAGPLAAGPSASSGARTWQACRKAFYKCRQVSPPPSPPIPRHMRCNRANGSLACLALLRSQSRTVPLACTCSHIRMPCVWQRCGFMRVGIRRFT